jgi:hypothetical protein
MDYILSPKIAKKFYCETCHYGCSKESDYNKHLMTRKHKKSYCGVTVDDNDVKKNIEYECECGNIYKHRQGLWKHKKKCSIGQGENNNKLPEFDIDKDFLIKMLLKNQDVIDKLTEIMPQLGNNSHNTNTNSHNTTNNQFNIQMFLNEHCKNAMNLTDFIQSLPITAETYDSTIENGLTKTMTNMLLNGLNELDIVDRPIHCTDVSRKTLYVKDDDIWEKDNELLHMLKGIRDLSLKQRTLIKKWQDVNNGWATDENLQSRMTKLIGNSMTAIENDERETGKIIRSISKNVYLDKDTKDEYLQLK